MPPKDKTGKGNKPKKTDVQKTKKTPAKNDKGNDIENDKESSNDASTSNKAPTKTKTEKEINAKQKQLKETKAKADQDAKNRKVPLKGKSKLQKEVAALETELVELKKKDMEGKGKRKEKEDEKKRKAEERMKKVEEKKKKEAEKNDNIEDKGNKARKKKSEADEAKIVRIVRKLEKEWENRDAEAEKQANFEKAKKAALRKRNEKQEIADEEAERRYHEESLKKEAERIKEQQAEGERLLQENFANIPWPLEGTVKRKAHLSQAEIADIEERFKIYIRDAYPHRLQAYLLRNENAAEIFRVRGGPLLQERVEKLYEEQLQNLPHTWITGDPDIDRDGRGAYEERRGTWHALLDRYYHAIGWPRRNNIHWSERPELQRLMHDPKRFADTARLSNERIKMCHGDVQALRGIFEEIFLGIGFRKTRNRLTRHIPGAPPRTRPSKPPERDEQGNIIKPQMNTKSDGKPTRKKKVFFTTSKWLKRTRNVAKRKSNSKGDDDDEDGDGNDTEKEPETKKQKTSKAPKTGKGKDKGKDGEKIVEVPVEVEEEPGEVSEGGTDEEEEYTDS